MLALIRRALTSWVVLLLLGILVVAFVITGVGDPFGGGGPAAGSLAKVGKDQITEVEFGQTFDRFMQRAREGNPTLTNEQAAREGGVEQILEQMIRSEALEAFGVDQGISVSQRFIDGQIAGIPAFQSGGKFDQATYERALAAQRISDRELRDGIRGDAIRSQLLQNLQLGAHVPQALVAPYASLLLESRSGTFAVVPAERMNVPAPTDAQVNAYYQANIKGYTIPERRPFRYALLTKAGATAGITVSDADVQRYYDEHQQVYGGIEQRALQQVVVQDRNVADRLAARAKAGEPFAKVAAELAGYTAADLDVGVQAQTRFAQSTSPAVAAAAFALPSGGVTAPIKSDFGWHVVRVNTVVPSRKRPLAEVRDEIVVAVRAERGEDALSDAVAAAQDAFDEGEGFADVAKARGLTVVEVPPVTRDGRVVDSDFKIEPRLASLLAQVFEPDNSEQPTVQEVDKETFALLDVGDAVPATPVALSKIRQAVAADWVRTEGMRLAKAAADAIVAESSKGAPLAAALSKRGLPAPRALSGRRIDIARGGQQVPPPLALMFSLPQGGIRAMPAPGGQGYFIVKVDAVKPGDPASEPGLIQATQSQIASAIPDELAGQFANAVEREVGVERNGTAIARVRDRYLGRGDTGDQ